MEKPLILQIATNAMILIPVSSNILIDEKNDHDVTYTVLNSSEDLNSIIDDAKDNKADYEMICSVCAMVRSTNYPVILVATPKVNSILMIRNDYDLEFEEDEQ